MLDLFITYVNNIKRYEEINDSIIILSYHLSHQSLSRVIQKVLKS